MKGWSVVQESHGIKSPKTKTNFSCLEKLKKLKLKTNKIIDFFI